MKLTSQAPRRWAVIAASASVLLGVLTGPAWAVSGPQPAGPIYGDTLDNAASSAYQKAVTGSQQAQSVGRTLTHRIVLDPGTTAADYAPAIHALSPVSNVMATIADSSAMKNMTLDAYKARTTEYINTFGSEINLYEIGNEINGEWLGTGAAQKAYESYKLVKAAGYQTVLTPYYNPNCWSNKANQMLPWLNANIPADMKAGVDYVMPSYYEGDCNGHRVTQAEMDSVFGQLHTMFPNAKLGWGEVGLSTSIGTDATKLARAKGILTYYYGLHPTDPTLPYVHGCFWWYGQEDLYPWNTKALWPTFQQAILAY